MSNSDIQMVLMDNRGRVGSALSFWAEGGGYTCNLDKAEIFTVADALAQHQSRHSDIPMRLDYLRARSTRMVDCQHLENREALSTAEDLAALAEGAKVYATLMHHFDGNAVYFVGETFDFDKAQALSKESAAVLIGVATCRIWPASHLAERAFPRVCSADYREALEGTGITLIVPRRPAKEVFHCGGCGRFRNVQQYYGETCQCGWSYQG